MSADLPPSRTLKRRGGGRKKNNNEQDADISAQRKNKQHIQNVPPSPSTPLRQIYSKMCVCLERPRLSGLRPPLPRKCQGVVTTSATVARWVTLGRRRGGAESSTHPGSWQMSYTSSMGTFCFLFTFLHPAALGLLSAPRQSAHTCTQACTHAHTHTHTHTHTNTGKGERQTEKERQKVDRYRFIHTSVSGLTEAVECFQSIIP